MREFGLLLVVPQVLSGCVMVSGPSQVNIAREPASQEPPYVSPYRPMYRDSYIDASGPNKKLIVEERYAPRPEKK